MAEKSSAISLEIPKFGQFVRQLVPITTGELEACLQEQQDKGGRLGDIMVGRGLITRQQIYEVLAGQARWVAQTRAADIGADGFPYPTFLSLCMPCFNEANVVESCLDAACAILPAFVEQFEVVVVNDGSADDTGTIVAAYAERDTRVRLVNHDQNRGYGAAVTSGLRAARGELVCFTDGDGQFNLLDLPQLLAHADDAQVVIGYRHQRADVGLRKLNAWSWNQLIRMVLGVRVRDLDCAFKMFHRQVVDQLKMTAEGACISAEIMVQCVRGGVTIREVPVSHHPRYHEGATGANLKVIAKAFRELPTLWKYRSTPPLNVQQPRSDEPQNGEAPAAGEFIRQKQPA